jgi:hypothetical protein
MAANGGGGTAELDTVWVTTSKRTVNKSKNWRNNLVAKPFLSGYLEKFAEVGLSDQCPQPSFT